MVPRSHSNHPMGVVASFGSPSKEGLSNRIWPYVVPVLKIRAVHNNQLEIGVFIAAKLAVYVI